MAGLDAGKIGLGAVLGGVSGYAGGLAQKQQQQQEMQQMQGLTMFKAMLEQANVNQQFANDKEKMAIDHKLTLERDKNQNDMVMARDVTQNQFKADETAKTQEASIRKAEIYAKARGYSAEALNDKRTLATAVDMNTDADGAIDWTGVQQTLGDIEQGKPLSEVAGRKVSAGPGQPGGQVDDLTAMDMADAVTNAQAHPLKPDSLDSGFDATNGDRGLFKTMMERAIKTGDKEGAYRLVGNDANARNILDTHFGPQNKSNPLTDVQEARNTPDAPLLLPQGGAADLVVGQWYQTARGPRKYLGWEGDKGKWEAPGETIRQPNQPTDADAMNKRDLGIPR